MTEWKTTVHILSSSQSSIAALKNVLADGRLTSNPPLPPPHTLFRTHQPPLYPISIPIGAVGGCGGGGGRGAELVILPFPMKQAIQFYNLKQTQETDFDLLRVLINEKIFR